MYSFLHTSIASGGNKKKNHCLFYNLRTFNIHNFPKVK